MQESGTPSCPRWLDDCGVDVDVTPVLRSLPDDELLLVPRVWLSLSRAPLVGEAYSFPRERSRSQACEIAGGEVRLP